MEYLTSLFYSSPQPGPQIGEEPDESKTSSSSERGESDMLSSTSEASGDSEWISTSEENSFKSTSSLEESSESTNLKKEIKPEEEIEDNELLSLLDKINYLKQEIFQTKSMFEKKRSFTPEEKDEYKGKIKELNGEMDKLKEAPIFRSSAFDYKILQILFGKKDIEDFPEIVLPEGYIFNARPDALGKNSIVTGFDHVDRRFYLIRARIFDKIGERYCLHKIFQYKSDGAKWNYSWYREPLEKEAVNEMEKGTDKFDQNAFQFYLGYGIETGTDTFIKQGSVPNMQRFHHLRTLIQTGEAKMTYLALEETHKLE